MPVVHDEPLFFVERGQLRTTASLLMPPGGPVSLRRAFSGLAFEEGRDFTVDPEAGVVIRTEGSRIPVTRLEELYPRSDPGGSEFMFKRGAPGTLLMWSEDGLFHRRQVHATYEPRPGAWIGPAPGFRGAEMPRTMRRLRAGDPMTIAVAGDSISEGYNASAFLGVPPYQKPYPDLVADGLAKAYRSRITLRNLAAAGSSSDQGVAEVDGVAAEHPDLVMVAFGMNDSGYAPAADFAANIAGLVAGVRREAPDAEFVLVSSMLPNPEWHYPVLERFDEYRDALGRLCGTGVVLADVTTVWRAVLARKSVYDLTGNGINHPNDFGHRIYAEVILAPLIDPRPAPRRASLGAPVP